MMKDFRQNRHGMDTTAYKTVVTLAPFSIDLIWQILIGAEVTHSH